MDLPPSSASQPTQDLPKSEGSVAHDAFPYNSDRIIKIDVDPASFDASLTLAAPVNQDSPAGTIEHKTLKFASEAERHQFFEDLDRAARKRSPALAERQPQENPANPSSPCGFALHNGSYYNVAQVTLKHVGWPNSTSNVHSVILGLRSFEPTKEWERLDFESLGDRAKFFMALNTASKERYGEIKLGADISGASRG